MIDKKLIKIAREKAIKTRVCPCLTFPSCPCLPYKEKKECSCGVFDGNN